MVSEPSELPRADVVAVDVAAPDVASELPTGRLIEASFALWQDSWKQTFWFALVYGIASLLPAFALQGVFADTLLRAAALVGREYLPTLPLPMPALFERDPMTLFDPLLARLQHPAPWLLTGVSLLAIVASTTALLVRQAGIARHIDPGAGAALRSGLLRAPATAGAWLLYTAIVLATALPFVALMFGAMVFGMNAGPAGLLLAMLVILVGGLLSSVPLAWASIAFGFAPFVTALEHGGPLAAQGRSMRLVHGHWWRCAVVVSMPLLIYVGAGGTVSSLLLLACGAVVVTLHGWTGLLDPGWLLWSQLLALPLQSALLPMAFAGGVVMFDDLRLRTPAAT